jgi:hypothetical protein
MSDYLTRLIERSVGLPPQIEPRIAPIHAPPGQMLSEPVETSAAFKSSPAAKIETSQQDTPPGVAVNGRGVEPAVSRAENQPPRSSTPPPESQIEFQIEKKDDRPYPSESRCEVRSRQTSSASRPEGADITEAWSPAPLPRGTPIVSQRATQIVVQPKTISPFKPAASPRESPPLLRRRTSASQEKSQIVVQPEIISPLKPAATPAVSLLQPSPKEPPAIHVTIGRVEVRAMMPAAQVKPPPERSAPKMSLDDYLRSRNGGQR